MIKVRRGLDLPIAGQAAKEIHAGPDIRSVALMGGDYVGLRPTLAVKEGDQVRPGQLLFADRDNADVRFTSPAGGVVRAILRGERRLLQSVVIDIDAAIDGAGSEPLPAWLPAELPGLRRDQVADGLVQSGLWTALRTRPYSKIPAPGSQPHSLFVTAMDTNPLSADPALVIAAASTDFSAGLQVLTRLVEGPVHLCVAAGADIQGVEGVTRHEFAGPHPAGLVGTHIHFIDPVSAAKTVWHIGYQDVIAIGRLFLTGCLDTARVVALSGPSVVNPLLLRTRLGASIADLTQGCLRAGDIRLISGSVLSGRRAEGPLGYLGRYHNQVSALE
ncbi:MAG: NADH:ubiquinone reductase (Na(+)-transporting) subunit A, partial [Gammaproteobacteria bacterium]